MSIPSFYQLQPAQPYKVQRPSLFRRTVDGVLTLLILVYVAGFAGYQVALYAFAEQWWQLRFYDIFGYLCYLPLPFLLLLLLLPGQRKIRLAALLLPLLFFGYEYGAAFVPKLHFAPTAIAQADVPVRVMTWNTYFVNDKLENLVAAVETEKPDILAVQEFGASYATEFAAALKADYPYQLLYPSWNPSGFAIFSRFPLKLQLHPMLGYDACSCIQAIVTIGEHKVTLISVHPTVPYTDVDFAALIPRPIAFDTYHQDLQHARIVERIELFKAPLLVVGDFNANDRMPVMDAYSAHLTDAFREAGWGFGFTFPTDLTYRRVDFPPLLRLDYIFHDATWRTTSAWTGGADGADHRYVVADLVLLAN